MRRNRIGELTMKKTVTKQDKRDIVNTINLLNETAWYIEEIVGGSNLEQHHKNMFNAVDVANEWLRSIIKENEQCI